MIVKFADPEGLTVTFGGVHVPLTVAGDPSSAVAGRAARDLKAWLAEGNMVAPYAAPPVDLVAYLADRRWRAEIGGTAWNGWLLPTDDRSQSKYLAELQAITLSVRIDPSPWKFPHGFEQVTNDQVREMAIAARDHILACFATEAELTAGIADGTITTTEQIDSAFAALTEGV